MPCYFVVLCKWDVFLICFLPMFLAAGSEVFCVFAHQPPLQDQTNSVLSSIPCCSVTVLWNCECLRENPVPCKILFSLWWCTRVVWSIGWKWNFEFAWDCCLDVQTASNDIYASFLVSYSVEFYFYQSMLRSFGTLVFSVVCAEPPLTYILSVLCRSWHQHSNWFPVVIRVQPIAITG